MGRVAGLLVVITAALASETFARLPAGIWQSSNLVGPFAVKQGRKGLLRCRQFNSIELCLEGRHGRKKG